MIISFTLWSLGHLEFTSLLFFIIISSLGQRVPVFHHHFRSVFLYLIVTFPVISQFLEVFLFLKSTCYCWCSLVTYVLCRLNSCVKWRFFSWCMKQKIWVQIGESEAEKDRMLMELERECLQIYQRKVDEAANSKAQLHQIVV